MKCTLLAITLIVLKSTESFPERNGFEDSRQATKPISEQLRQFPNPRFFESTLSSFRPTTSTYDDVDNNNDNIVSPSQATHSRTPAYGDDNYPFRNSIPIVSHRPQPKPLNQVQQFRKSSIPQQTFKQQLEENKKFDEEKEEEEEEEPDRLSILLPQSKFECVGKNTGYYADEGLGCEVFHYCQDNARHSWICPDGFTFHQVHLICMPPGHDNICSQSSQYHFVNEYLYKPVNLEEHQNKPNVSLRYSDRYYPDNYNYQRDYNEEEEEDAPNHRQPIAVTHRATPTQRRPQPTPFSPTIRTDTIGQVFRSPEEINISLQQRRPPYITQRFLPEHDY